MGSVNIIDTTLREGNQSPRTRFTLRQAIEIARMLDAVGVDMIECGHAIVGVDERERILALSKLGLTVPLLSHARAKREDIIAAKESGADWIGIFCGINRISRLTRLRDRSQDSVIDMIRQSISFAKSLGLNVRYTLEDGTRTPLELVVKILGAAILEGADRICYADTLGAMSPLQFAETIRTIRNALPKTDLEIHVHDDRGFAMANAWVGIEAGASWVSTSVNGLGERCGITDLATMLANLDMGGYKNLRNSEALQDVCAYVGAVTRTPPDARRPIIGKNAFTHTAKLHSEAVRKNPLAYAVFDAPHVGREIQIAHPTAERKLQDLMVAPQVISATELKYHRAGPGSRYVMIDERFVKDAGQYCIVRDIPPQDGLVAGHVDPHRHTCDSLFMFIGREHGMEGLSAEVLMDGQVTIVHSPTAVFLPAGVEHSYRVLGGQGLYVNHVLAGDYNSSLLETKDYSLVGKSALGSAQLLGTDVELPENGWVGNFQTFSQRVLAFLVSISDRSQGSFTDDMDLMEAGVLDSIGLLELLLFIEEIRGEPIQVETLDVDSVRTIRKMYATFCLSGVDLP